MRKRARRARMKERVYSVAVDTLYILLGTMIVWLPLLLAVVCGWTMHVMNI